MKDNLAFDFSFDVTGQIWQVAVDELSGNIGVEVRAEADQDISFLVFQTSTLTVSDYFTIDETDWWTTLVRIKEDFLFLDKYEDQQDPTKKTLLIFDSSSCTLVRKITDFQIVEFSDQGLVGQIKNNGDADSIIIYSDLGIRTGNSQSESVVFYPLFYPETSETFTLASEYLKKELALGVEYFEQGETIIISYYQRSGSKFERLLVLIESGHEVFHELIDESLTGYASGAFFIANEYLIFITNGNQINGIKI